MNELIVDNFAGGGGASLGIETALGRPVDFAINHDPEAIAMHRINHPFTRHFCENVWDVDPVAIAAGRPIGLAWFSPDCTYHSKARGGKPFRDRNRARRVRGLAWLVPYWMKKVRPRVVMLENVEEFADWGPLLPDGKPCPLRRGLTFRRWHRQIENLGYRIDMRELRACDYGAPTSRKRLFIIARCDGQEIVFPEPTHGPWRDCKPYRTAAECIDWSIPCPSIFERKRPLAEATLRRIARGVMRYVVNNPQPFIVQVAHGDWGYRDGARVKPVSDPIGPITAGGGQFALVAPVLATMRGTSREHIDSSTRSANEPVRTISAGGQHHALVAAFLARHYGGHENDGAPLDAPMFTITTRDHHALVVAFLLKFYGNERDAHPVDEPLGTITTKDRFGLVMVRGEQYRIVDIGMRMLTPRELYRAQSFPDSYVIEYGHDANGEVVELSKTAQVRMCGNSVPPVVAEALVRANVVEQREQAVA